jgi:multidrug transporter EmrE-like cation transporter
MPARPRDYRFAQEAGEGALSGADCRSSAARALGDAPSRWSEAARILHCPGCDMAMGYLFLALALVLNATANVLLKLGAARLGGLDLPNPVGRLITNYHLLAGLGLFALNVVFYLLALIRLNLSIAYPIMTAGGVVIIVAVSVLLLQEALTTRQAVGLLLLIAGIVLVAERSTA